MFKVINFLIFLMFVDHSFADKVCAQKLEIKTVRGDSMKGLFNHDQDLEVDMNYYQCHKPQRNDKVIVLKKGFPAPIIKTLSIMPGDHFELIGTVTQGAELVVNGKPLENGLGQTFRFKDNAFKMLKLYENEFKQKAPAGFYFVFGTQGNGSRDSSKFGPIQESEIIGKVLRIKKESIPAQK